MTCALHTPARWRRPHTLGGAPLDGKKNLSAVSLNASSHLFSPGATCVDECCAVYHQLALVSLLFLLLVSLLLKKYNLVLFITDISTFILVLLILVFVLCHFLKVLFILYLIFNSNFSYTMFFNMIILFLISIFFLGLFVKILMVFNFIIQSKFVVFFFFNLILILLISFLSF